MASKRKQPQKPSTPKASVSRRKVDVLPDFILSRLKVDRGQFEAIQEFMGLESGDKRSAARKIITDMVIEATTTPDTRVTLALTESESLLPGYATLDEPHLAGIQRLIDQVTGYLRDKTRQRPLNALMLAAPGAGKSHFIKQLAAKMQPDRVQAVTFNMATMHSPDDMAQPIDELRNLKVDDRFPLLFLDEFDSDPARYSALLPLLWDGELQIGHRALKLGKAVVVLAGSNPDLPKAMAQSATMRLESDTGDTVPRGKLVDLLSRISGGVIDIPELDLRTADRDRRVDKVCATVALVRRRFGPGLQTIPRSLLRFVAHTKFRYGVRSIAHLIDSIDSTAFKDGALTKNEMGLPMNSEQALQGSSLTLHLLDKDQGFGIVNRWKEFAKDAVTVEVRHGGDLFSLVQASLWRRR